MLVCVHSQHLLFHAAYAAPPPDAFSGSDIEVAGGSFTECRCSDNGGFLFASEKAEVKITGGNIVNNLAETWCRGESNTALRTTQLNCMQCTSALQCQSCIISFQLLCCFVQYFKMFHVVLL